jgi:ABC-type multidrug transport system fused ATPase/permease subunit
MLLKKIIETYFSNLLFFYRFLRLRVFVVLALSILVAFLDGLGLTMFLPLLQIADGQQEATSVGLGKMGFVVDALTSIGLSINLITVLCVIVFFFCLKGIAVFLSKAYAVSVRQFFMRALRMRLINQLCEYSYKDFATADAGRIQNSLTGEVARVTTGYVNYFSSLQGMFLVGVYMLFAFLVDWRFAGLTTIGGVLTNLIFRRIYRLTKEASRKVSAGNTNLQGLLVQFITHFRYLKATGSLRTFGNKLRVAILDIEKNNSRIGMLDARISASREPLIISVVCLVIALQVYVLEGSLSSVLISLVFFYRSLAALMTVQTSYNSFLGVSGSLENIEKMEQEFKSGREESGTIQFEGLKAGLELRNVGFRYGSGDWVLKDINLSVQRNQTLAFVGQSGSGKTTLMNIISGLVHPSVGSFEIDGIPSEQLDIRTYQNRIGYISQDPVVFNDTIFNNVTFWAKPEKENQLRFDRAIGLASLEGFVKALPDGRETLLGNNGINLSGGQKQRISIARELYKDVDILIFDEATSSLDSETEKQIQENIEMLRGKYTILIVAHRLSTVKNADVIFVMDKGTISERGSFDYLMANSKRFRRMVELQEI